MNQNPIEAALPENVHRPTQTDESMPDVVVPEAAPSAAVIATPMPAASFDEIVSGQFDATQESPELMPSKRVLPPESDQPKLHKVLAQAGLGGRLEMEAAIEQGRVSVNGETAHVGMRLQRGDHISFDGAVVHYQLQGPQLRVLAYHKPAGEVVTHDDPQNRPTVFRKLPKLRGGKWQSVGRLDINTEGLLLFTNSGELANRLMHPRFGLEREYAVRVLGALSNEEKEKLLAGVVLEDGLAQFGSIEEGGGEGANCWYRVTIGEGRNREVRRMIEHLGHAVSRLIRIRYGKVQLPKGLKRGYWVELDEADVKALREMTGLQEDMVLDAPSVTNLSRAHPRRGRFGRIGERFESRRAGQSQAPQGAEGRSSSPSSSPSESPKSRAKVDGRSAQPMRAQPQQPRRMGGGSSAEGVSSAFKGRFKKSPRFDSGHPPGDFEARDPNPNHINPERTSVDFSRSQRGPARGPGRGGSGVGGMSGGAGGGVDPMRTSFGYIGGDALQRQRADGGGRFNARGNAFGNTRGNARVNARSSGPFAARPKRGDR